MTCQGSPHVPTHLFGLGFGLNGRPGGSTRSIGCHALSMRFLLPSNFSSVIMIRNRVSNFFSKSLFFLYLRKRWFKSQSRACISLFFCGRLGEGESISVVGTDDECYFFFFFTKYLN